MSKDKMKQPLLGSGAGAGSGSQAPAVGANVIDLTPEMEKEFLAMTNQSTGLTEQVVIERRSQFGFNELSEKKVHPLMVFLGYLWGPMPIMIWVAATVEFIKGIVNGDGWVDFVVLMILQFANATVGFIEEHNAGNAIAALKQALAPQCHVCRAGRWFNMPARELVPGDLIEVKLGDIVPADAILLPGQSLQVDQAALTGESLPVTLHPGEKAKMGSAIKRGETRCVVVGTGKNTFFGKAAEMINQVEHVGRFQKILNKITLILLVLCTIFSAGIFIKLVVQQGWNNIMSILSVVVVIFVASIPVAIEVVCTSTLAVGSRRLAQKKVIVARLSAIEELAGMTILCSDKTGTLTLNKLSLREPIILHSQMSDQDIVFYAALASKREEGNQDAIDFCITQAVPAERRAVLKSFQELDFFPFNPTDKRTEGTIKGPDGSCFKVTKGAPQVILRLCANRDEIRERVERSVQELADRGFRSLGVAISYTAPDAPCNWEYLGILSLFDPPRHDTKDTIAAAIANGVEVKMVTGDQTAIAKETCRELGMGTNILNTEVLNDPKLAEASLDEIILNAHGFAEVMPEHKFRIVDRLRQQGHVTGMTGDGVNDAPALKRADIGIAVQGATDAARAAADIVLTQEGLSVIIDAIFRSRKIFQRMRNYCIYRISCTLQLLFFFFFAIIAFEPNDFYNTPADLSTFTPDPSFYNDTTNCNAGGDLTKCPFLWHRAAFTLPVLSMVIITVLNDGTMITIAHDKVIPEKRPQRWAMFEVTIISLVLSLVACLSSLILLLVLLSYNFNKPGSFAGNVWGTNDNGSGRFIIFQEAQVIIYLKISLSDFLTLFSGRTRTWFWERRPGYALAAASIFATGMSTLFSVVWGLMFQNVPDARMSGLLESKTACIGTWIYCIIWFFAQDAAKVLAYYVLSKLTSQDEDRAKQVAGKSKIASMIDDDRRLARLRGGNVGREISFASISDALEGSAVVNRISTLEAEVASLKAALSTKASH